MNSKNSTTTTTKRPLRMAEIKRRNTAIGWCWFSRDSMRYWNTRLFPCTITAASGKHTLFVSSDTAFADQPNTARYTVLRFEHETARVHYISQFQEFDTLDDATAYMRHIAQTI